MNIDPEQFGREYREFDGHRDWEFLFEKTLLVILKHGQFVLGFDADTLRSKWAYDASSENGVSNIYHKNGNFWVGTWVGVEYEIEYTTGRILSSKFSK